MKIGEVIDRIKDYCKHTTEFGKEVSDEHDKIIYDSGLENECTGIVTTAFASVDVIRKAAQMNANLIISHEGMFWNHGDDTSWLSENTVFKKKTQLLHKYGITVWRNCEYMNSGIKRETGYVDAIAYGFVKTMGWGKYLDPRNIETGCTGYYLKFDLSEKDVTAEDIARECKRATKLNGITLVGNKSAKVKKLYLSRHQFLGVIDKQIIEDIEQDKVDCIICGEMVDYTVAEYIRDGVQAGIPKAIIKMGNFNICDCGMKFTENWMPEAIQDETVKVTFVSGEDPVSKYII